MNKQAGFVMVHEHIRIHLERERQTVEWEKEKENNDMTKRQRDRKIQERLRQMGKYELKGVTQRDKNEEK